MQDSVIAGDVVQSTSIQSNVTVNDANSITEAIKSASECVACGSICDTHITCSVCKIMSHCNICINDISNIRKQMRLCPRCELVELEKRKIDTDNMNKMRYEQLTAEQEKKILQEKFYLKVSAVAIAIGIFWLLWSTIMVIWMQNFCEEKYDYENGEFEGSGDYRRDSLLDEGPLGADCYYGGWQSPGEVRFHWDGMGMHFAVPGWIVVMGAFSFFKIYSSRTKKIY